MQACSSTMLRGTPLPQQRVGAPRVARTSVQTTAFFGKRAAVLEEAPPAPAAKKGVFSGNFKFAAKPQQAAAPAKQAPAKQAPAKKQQQRPSSTAKSSKAVVDKAAEYDRRQSTFGKVISAFDFAEVRSKSDRELLYDAKYGKRGASGKMTPEQAAALRRRVVGTKADYWKDWVDVKGEFVEKGYVSKDKSSTASSVPALPFLVAVVVGLLGTTAYVVTLTS